MERASHTHCFTWAPGRKAAFCTALLATAGHSPAVSLGITLTRSGRAVNSGHWMQGFSSSWFWFLKLHTSLTFCDTEADERGPWPTAFNAYKPGSWAEKGMWQQTLGTNDQQAFLKG